MVRPAVVDGVDLDLVAAAVRACLGVDDLDAGPPNARVATYLPGRTIDGLRLAADAWTVQIRGVWGVPAPEVADRIRTALTPLSSGQQVDVIIADLTPAPGYEPPPPAPPPTPASEPTEPPEPETSPEPATPPELAAPPEPVVVERTITVVEKVLVQDGSALDVPLTDVVADLSAALDRPSAPDPAPSTSQPADSVEGDPEEWTTATPPPVAPDAPDAPDATRMAPGSDRMVPITEPAPDPASPKRRRARGAGAGRSSGPTTPTPAVTPPPS